MMLALVDELHWPMWGLIDFILLSCAIEEMSLLHAEAEEADVPFASFLKDIFFKK